MSDAEDVRFGWDASKAATNLRKHGVSFDEAATAFEDRFARVQHDPDNSDYEDRFILLGESELSRILVVGFADRGDAIRLISARKATPTERREYEEEK